MWVTVNNVKIFTIHCLLPGPFIFYELLQKNIRLKDSFPKLHNFFISDTYFICEKNERKEKEKSVIIDNKVIVNVTIHLDV